MHPSAPASRAEVSRRGSTRARGSSRSPPAPAAAVTAGPGVGQGEDRRLGRRRAAGLDLGARRSAPRGPGRELVDTPPRVACRSSPPTSWISIAHASGSAWTPRFAGTARRPSPGRPSSPLQTRGSRPLSRAFPRGPTSSRLASADEREHRRGGGAREYIRTTCSISAAFQPPFDGRRSRVARRRPRRRRVSGSPNRLPALHRATAASRPGCRSRSRLRRLRGNCPRRRPRAVSIFGRSLPVRR